MKLNEIVEKVSKVSDTYSRNCKIDRDHDWYLLKIQEELGELTQQHLKLSSRGRTSGTLDQHQQNLEDEFADVFAQVLLYAQKFDINIVEALERKWFKWLNK